MTERYTAQSWKTAIRNLFETYGAQESDAKIVADSLVEADLMGHESHGIARAPMYIEKISSGDLNLSPTFEVTDHSPSMTTFDGDWGFGQIVGLRATEVAIDRAKSVGLSCTLIKNSNHIGRLGQFTELAAGQGYIAIATANLHGSSHVVAPFGGIDRRLPTNPISIAAPRKSGNNFILDMSTSVISEGKLKLKYFSGEAIHPDTVIDYDGNMVIDPRRFYEEPKGALLPLGSISGHKVFGLALAIDILSGALSEAGCSREKFGRHGNACMITLIDIGRFIGLDQFEEHIQELESHVKSSRPQDSAQPILMPGEQETLTKRLRLQTGLQINAEVKRQLIALGQEKSLDFASSLIKP